MKIDQDCMAGTSIKMLSRTSDDINLNFWFDMYPNYEHVILVNNKELDLMFAIFKDMTPITSQEKKPMKGAK